VAAKTNASGDGSARTDRGRRTDLVVSFVDQSGLDSFPKAAKVTAAFLIADCLAVMVAGSDAPASKHVASYASQFSGTPSAPIVGTNAVVPMQLAALVNGTSAHALDFDDDEPAVFIGHPTSPVLTALVSLAHARTTSGGDLLAAFLIGTDVQSAIAKAVNPQHYLDGWHATSTLGVIGATAAGAKLLGLDRDALARALGIAASCVAGLKANFGTMTKPLHVGRAGEAAVNAVLLAEAGFTANDAILDGPLGLVEVLGADPAVADDAVTELGVRHAVLDPGVAIKRYPCCSSTHPALDALLELRDQRQFEPESIARIRCELAPPAAEILIYDKPATPLEGKFSMSYCLAVGAVRGSVNQTAFTEAALNDRQVMSLVDRVEVSYTDGLNQPGIGVSTAARVGISLDDGSYLEQIAWQPKGSARVPLSQDELWGKFWGCTSDCLTEAAAKATFDEILALELQPDFAELISSLCRIGPAGAVVSQEVFAR
jgi:2-methylcitrate dehydratase PrpD